MQIHQLKGNTLNKNKKRVGRGGKRGTFSGHGIKGQKSRAGRRMRPEVRDIIKKIPKLRGYSFKPVETRPVTVNLGVLDKNFNNGDTVNSRALVEKKIVSKGGRAFPQVKILATGDLTKKLNFVGCIFSDTAKEKVVKSGGNIS